MTSEKGWQIKAYSPKTTLTVRQISVAKSLAEGMTRAEAAKTNDVGERTIYRWLNTAEFRHVVHELQQAYLYATIGSLASKGRHVVDFLFDVMNGRFEGDQDFLSHRIRAAGILLKATESISRAEELRMLRFESVTEDAFLATVRQITDLIKKNFKDEDEKQKFLNDCRRVGLSPDCYTL